jgi:hypothetical protein
MFMLLFLRL